MSRSASTLPESLVGRPFTVHEAWAAGVTERRLAHQSLRAPYRGIRSADSAPQNIVARCLELLPLLPTAAVFSHGSALDLLGIDRPHGLRHPTDLHVQVPDGTAPPRHSGVRGHTHTGRRAQLRRDGLPVSTAEWLWVDLAGELDHDELVVAGDALLRRRHPLTTQAQLEKTVARLRPGTRGIRRLRSALTLLRPGTDSCMETRLRLTIIAAGLPCPLVNVKVSDQRDRFIAMPDLIYPEARLAVEYDGDIHRTDPRTWRRDITRRRALRSAGWTLLTCTADDLHSPTQIAQEIRTALTSPR